MLKNSYHILRFGLAITFIWIGVLIWRSPEAWGGYLQPWAAALVSVPIKQAMLGTAIFDLVVGFLLLIGKFTRLAALAGALHLIVVLVTSGINAITVRDIGLLAAALALFFSRL